MLALPVFTPEPQVHKVNFPTCPKILTFASMEKILVIGAGLCGTLLAIRLAQRGYKVELREKRPDMRKTSMSAGRSINLALSNRGLKALRLIGMEEQVQEACIPMPGRLIHPIQGDLLFAPYSGRQGEFINSVSRGGLNCQLLDEAEKHPNITIHFNSGCTAVDLKEARATFRDEQTGTLSTEEAAVVFGTDGSGSALRQAMLGHIVLKQAT